MYGVHCVTFSNILSRLTGFFSLMVMMAIVLKDTKRIWNASVKAIPYFCKFTPEPRLLKYVFLHIEDSKY